ncbi:MAG: prephenate dehydrogenase [Anaerolineales bacterium]|nr:prephenate dehydrogenase [Anaerolineales bacterium]
MNILILGLDEVGASIGLALGKTEGEVTRIGYDADKQRARTAKDLGAVDSLVSHPRKASALADVVILSIPVIDEEDYLDLLGEKMKSGSVVIDTARQKTKASRLAAELLPEDVTYIGMTPIVGPKVLEAISPSWPEPHAEMFLGGLTAMIVPPSTSDTATEFALRLSEVLGATPFFLEVGEHDAVTAVEDGIPFLLSAAFVNLMTQQPNWREARRMAGPTFSAFSAFHSLNRAKVLGRAMHINRDVLLKKLDELDAELDIIRNRLESEEPDDLVEYLARAEVSRETLIHARERADWSGEEINPTRMKEMGGLFGNLFGISPRPPKEDQ